MTPKLPALAIAAIIMCAAQDNSWVTIQPLKLLPPVEFDHDYTGDLTIERLDPEAYAAVGLTEYCEKIGLIKPSK